MFWDTFGTSTLHCTQDQNSLGALSPRLCCILMAVAGITHFRIQPASYKIPQHCSLPVAVWDPCSGPLSAGEGSSVGSVTTSPRLGALCLRDFPPLQHKSCWTGDEGVMMSLKASLMYFSASLRHTLSQRTKVCLQLVNRWQMLLGKKTWKFPFVQRGPAQRSTPRKPVLSPISLFLLWLA